MGCLATKRKSNNTQPYRWHSALNCHKNVNDDINLSLIVIYYTINLCLTACFSGSSTVAPVAAFRILRLIISFSKIAALRWENLFELSLIRFRKCFLLLFGCVLSLFRGDNNPPCQWMNPNRKNFVGTIFPTKQNNMLFLAAWPECVYGCFL